MLLLGTMTLYLCLLTAASPPQLIKTTSRTFQLTTYNQCNSASTSSISSIVPPRRSHCLDLLVLHFDRPLYLHSSPAPSTTPPTQIPKIQPVPLNGMAVQHMIDRKQITFQGNPARCLSWRTYVYDRYIRHKVNQDTEDADIDLLMHDRFNRPTNHPSNVMSFIQRSPCAEREQEDDNKANNDNAKQTPMTCTVQINNTLLGTYRGTHRGTTNHARRVPLFLTPHSFIVQNHIEQVYSYNIEPSPPLSLVPSSTPTANHTSKANNMDDDNNDDDNNDDDDDDVLWGGSCHVLPPTASERKELQRLNLSSLALLETKDRMAIMTGVFKGLVTDVVDGTVAGAAGPILEQTEERTGEADSDDMRGKVETSLDGTAPIKISELLEASLTYNLTGILTDAVTASLAPRLSSAVLENVGSVVARAVVDHVPNIVSDDIASLLLATIGERLDTALPHLLQRSLTPNLINILTRSVTHALVPTLSKSLTHNSRQRYWCWACFHHKLYCNYCHDSATSSYYTNYYDAYYSDFFSDYYGTYYSDATRNLDSLQHPRGKDAHNPRCGSGSGDTECLKSKTTR